MLVHKIAFHHSLRSNEIWIYGFWCMAFSMLYSWACIIRITVSESEGMGPNTEARQPAHHYYVRIRSRNMPYCRWATNELGPEHPEARSVNDMAVGTCWFHIWHICRIFFSLFYLFSPLVVGGGGWWLMVDAHDAIQLNYHTGFFQIIMLQIFVLNNLCGSLTNIRVRFIFM